MPPHQRQRYAFLPSFLPFKLGPIELQSTQAHWASCPVTACPNIAVGCHITACLVHHSLPHRSMWSLSVQCTHLTGGVAGDLVRWRCLLLACRCWFCSFGCDALTHLLTGLQSISRGCVRLRELDLYECSLLTVGTHTRTHALLGLAGEPALIISPCHVRGLYAGP